MERLKNFMMVMVVAMTMASFPQNISMARDSIRIVGSSTVFPFSTVVAERFSQKSGYAAPVVESTGTGGGMKLFCAGLGADFPDVVNASRRIKKREFDNCARNGVGIVEVRIGFDGVVLAGSLSGPELELTIEQLFLALAKQTPVNGELVDNPYMRWSDIEASLPDARIRVLGPPATSGTRDAFVELVMEKAAGTFPILKKLSKTDPEAFKAVAHAMREDGAFVKVGENDNLVIQKLIADPSVFGIFGFSFLDQNTGKIRGIGINGVSPTFENIANGSYGISRSLYFYVKKEHVRIVPGLQGYIVEFTSDGAWGDEGYLVVDKGLVPLPADDRKRVARDARKMTLMGAP